MSSFINTLDENMRRHITAIKEPALNEFVVRALDEYGSVDKLEEGNDVADVMMAMLKKRKQVHEGEPLQVWIEVMIAAALLHNLFYEGTVTSLFAAREKLTPLAKECKVHTNAYYSIFQAIECQLGDDTPIESCRPVPSTPNEIFAWACWFVEELHGCKEIPA